MWNLYSHSPSSKPQSYYSRILLPQDDGIGCETAPNSAKKTQTPSRAGRVAPTSRQTRHSLRTHSIAAPWTTPNRTCVSTLFNFRPAPHYSSVIFKSPIRSGSIKVEPRILDLTEPPIGHTVKRALRMLESKKRTCASVSSDVSSLPTSDDDDVLLSTSKRRRLQMPVPNSHEDYDVSAIGNTHVSDGFHFTSIGQLRGTVPLLRREHFTVSVGTTDADKSTTVLANESTESQLTGVSVDRSSSAKPPPDQFRSPISAEASVRRRIPYMSPAELDALFNSKCKPLAKALEEGEQSGSDQDEFELPSLGRQFSERPAPSTHNVSPHPSRDTGTPLIETTTSATIDKVPDKRTPPLSRVNSVARFIANLEAYGSNVSTSDGSGMKLSPSIRCLSPSEMSARVSRIRRLLSSPCVSEATGTAATTQVMSSSGSLVPSALPAFSMLTSVPPAVSLSAPIPSTTGVSTSVNTFAQPTSTGAPTDVKAPQPFAFSFPPTCLAAKSPAASTVPPTTTVGSLPTFTLPTSSTTATSVGSVPSMSTSSADVPPPFRFPAVTSAPATATPSSVVQPDSVVEKPDSGTSVVSASNANAFVPAVTSSVTSCPNSFNFVSTSSGSQPPVTISTQTSMTTVTAAPLFSFSTIPAVTTTSADTTAQMQMKTSVNQSFTFGSLTSWSSPKPASTQAVVTAPSVALTSSQSETKTSNETSVTFVTPTTVTSTGSTMGFNFSVPNATSTTTTASAGFSFATAPLNTTTTLATTTAAAQPASSLFQTPATTTSTGALKPVFSFPSLSSASSTPSTFGLTKPLATTTAMATTTTTTTSSSMFNFGSKLGSASTFGFSNSMASTTTTTSLTSSAFVFGKPDKQPQPSTVFSSFGVSTASTTPSTTSANLFTLGVKPATVAGPVTFTAPTASTTSSWFGTPAFGAPAATTAASATSASGFSFASSATNTTGLPSVATAPGQLFQFGASSSGNLFAATTTTSSILAPAASASPVFAFGQQASTTSPFQTAISSANSIIPSFENPKTTTATSAPFQFGTSQSTSGFNFGQTSLPTAGTPTAFGTTPASTTGFVFGQISNAFNSQQQQQQPMVNNPFAFGTTPPNPSGAIATPRRRVTAARSRRRP